MPRLRSPRKSKLSMTLQKPTKKKVAESNKAKEAERSRSTSRVVNQMGLSLKKNQEYAKAESIDPADINVPALASKILEKTSHIMKQCVHSKLFSSCLEMGYS